MKAYGYVKIAREFTSGRGDARDGRRVVDECCIKTKKELLWLFEEQPLPVDPNPLGREFCNMVKALAKNNINWVIVPSLTDLGDDELLRRDIILYLASKEVRVISAVDGMDLTESVAAAEKAAKELITLRRQFTRLDRSLEMIRLISHRQNERTRRGKCEGRKSYGEIAPETVREIGRLRRKRKGRQYRTYQEVADILNENGFVTASGKVFTGNNVSVIWHRHKAELSSISARTEKLRNSALNRPNAVQIP